MTPRERMLGIIRVHYDAWSSQSLEAYEDAILSAVPLIMEMVLEKETYDDPKRWGGAAWRQKYPDAESIIAALKELEK